MNFPRPALSGPLHRLLHVVIVIAGWAFFFWGWWRVVTGDPMRPAVISALIIVTVVVAPLLTMYWVLHNRDIYRRKGQRLSGRKAEDAYREDWVGRLVHARFDKLRDSHLIVIRNTPDDKYYMTQADALSTREPAS